MDKSLARINQLTLEINRIKHEYKKRQNKTNTIRERVLGRYVINCLRNDLAKIRMLQYCGVTLNSFVTKPAEREIFGFAPRPRTKQASDESDQ